METGKKLEPAASTLGVQGLKMDWNFRPEVSNDKRDASRLFEEELSDVFKTPKIAVKISTIDSMYTGVIQDLSSSGMAVLLERPLKMNESIKAGFILGKRTVLCQGTVRHIRRADREGRGHICGVMFTEIDKNISEHLSDLVEAFKKIKMENM